jgi:hypothetical protein
MPKPNILPPYSANVNYALHYLIDSEKNQVLLHSNEEAGKGLRIMLIGLIVIKTDSYVLLSGALIH